MPLFEVEEGVNLYYEVQGNPASPHKILCIMGKCQHLMTHVMKNILYIFNIYFISCMYNCLFLFNVLLDLLIDHSHQSKTHQPFFWPHRSNTPLITILFLLFIFFFIIIGVDNDCEKNEISIGCSLFYRKAARKVYWWCLQGGPLAIRWEFGRIRYENLFFLFIYCDADFFIFFQIDYFAQFPDFEICIFDNRGSGLSSAPPGKYTYVHSSIFLSI